VGGRGKERLSFGVFVVALGRKKKKMEKGKRGRRKEEEQKKGLLLHLSDASEKGEGKTVRGKTKGGRK